jgi:ubiquitin-like modifier-activating enzyme ATG7
MCKTLLLIFRYCVFREYEVQKPLLAAHGILLNKNTLETFKNCNKIALLEELGQELWQSITSGKALDNPALLSRFFLLTYAVILAFI